MNSHDITVDADEMDRRIIAPSDFVADTEAFVDVRLEHSVGKASYSFIGPGVSQNAEQTINLMVPHGFNVGAASMPSGVVNNQHLHFTPEVFICTGGKWRMNVGEESDQSIDIDDGTVFSVPPWVFRGFENIGPDDGWLFVVLGGDDTGGIIWAPYVLRAAAETGMYLTPDYTLIDAGEGPEPESTLKPFTAEELDTIDSYSNAELESRIVRPDSAQWSHRALLSAVVGGSPCEIAPVIGHGMSEDRTQTAPIMTPHGFSYEWVRIPPGSEVSTHRHDRSQVLFVVDGELELVVNRGDDELTRRPHTGSVVSIPESAWRSFRNVGDDDLLLGVVNGGDAPVALEWCGEVVSAAREAGWAIDANGDLAPAHLVGER